MNAQVEAEILTEARRAIAFQHSSLDEIRARSGILLAAASVAVSVLGTTAASRKGGLDATGYIAVVVFAIAVVTCLVVLWPWKWTFVMSPTILKEDWVDTQRPNESLEMFLADRLENYYDTNETKFKWLRFSFQIAAISVAAEVILLAVQVSN